MNKILDDILALPFGETPLWEAEDDKSRDKHTITACRKYPAYPEIMPPSDKYIIVVGLGEMSSVLDRTPYIHALETYFSVMGMGAMVEGFDVRLGYTYSEEVKVDTSPMSSIMDLIDGVMEPVYDFKDQHHMLLDNLNQNINDIYLFPSFFIANSHTVLQAHATKLEEDGGSKLSVSRACMPPSFRMHEHSIINENERMTMTFPDLVMVFENPEDAMAWKLKHDTPSHGKIVQLKYEGKHRERKIDVS